MKIITETELKKKMKNPIYRLFNVNLSLVPNNKEYWESIRELRNDNTIQKGFIEQVSITKKQQITYMEKHNNDYSVCLNNGVFAGYIGIVENDLRLAVRKSQQRHGIGSYMLKNYLQDYKNVQVKVKRDNVASLCMFLKNGWIIDYVRAGLVFLEKVK